MDQSPAGTLDVTPVDPGTFRSRVLEGAGVQEGECATLAVVSDACAPLSQDGAHEGSAAGLSVELIPAVLGWANGGSFETSWLLSPNT